MVVADPSSPQAPAGRAMVVCLAASLEALDRQMRSLGFDVVGVDNPYEAFVELLERPLVYRSLVLSLAAIYREELPLIKSIRSRLPHIDVLLTHTDGRAAAMAEAMRLGATGLLDEDTVHRLGDIDPPPTLTSDASRVTPTSSVHGEGAACAIEEESNELDPILTAEELRALLQEQPTLPGHG